MAMVVLGSLRKEAAMAGVEPANTFEAGRLIALGVFIAAGGAFGGLASTLHRLRQARGKLHFEESEVVWGNFKALLIRDIFVGMGSALGLSGLAFILSTSGDKFDTSRPDHLLGAFCIAIVAGSGTRTTS